MKIGLIQRKKNNSFFSIEKVFSSIKKHASGEFDLVDIELPFRSRGLFSICLNLLYLLRFRKGNYHVTGDIHYAVLALPRRSTILTIHDLVFLYQTRGIKKMILKWLYLDLPVRRSAAITTISVSTKQDIIRHTNVAHDKITVIPNPLTMTFRSTPYDSGRKPYRLLFIGTKKNKNLSNAIEAIKGLDLQLDIIGRIPEREMELLNRLKIRFTEQYDLSESELQHAYEETDIIYFPTLFEGFGLPIIEGFQAGRPVLTSDLPPMKDIAEGAAMLVDPYMISSIREGLMLLLNDQMLRESMVKKGIEIAGKYAPEHIIKFYESIWTKNFNNG